MRFIKYFFIFTIYSPKENVIQEFFVLERKKRIRRKIFVGEKCKIRHESNQYIFISEVSSLDATRDENRDAGYTKINVDIKFTASPYAPLKFLSGSREHAVA
jgi:hypothetical protein